MTHMDQLTSLAHTYELAKTPDIKRQVLASALAHPQLDSFVLEHSEGWNGTVGNFARVLARVIQSL